MIDAMKDLLRYGKPTIESKFKIVTKHPLANEKDLLERLKMNPNECISCDLYWMVHKRLVFVSIWGQREEPRVNFWQDRGRRWKDSINISSRLPYLELTHLDNALTLLKPWLIDFWDQNKKLREPTRIFDYDICRSPNQAETI